MCGADAPIRGPVKHVRGRPPRETSSKQAGFTVWWGI